jgi:hypothetical protein
MALLKRRDGYAFARDYLSGNPSPRHRTRWPSGIKAAMTTVVRSTAGSTENPRPRPALDGLARAWIVRISREAQ